MDFKDIQKSIKEKNFAPFYILHGEEGYFIDLLVDAFEQNVLEESEKDFNQDIVYGKDAEAVGLLSALNSYPLMATKRLVVLKEAQNFPNLEDLESYFENPSPTTVFVIAHKYKKIDARKKYVKSASKNGVMFVSDKVKEDRLEEWIMSYMKNKGYTFASKVPSILSSSLGNDLSRIVNELNKLDIVLESGTHVTEEHVENNIGISKEYNIFELKNAVAKRDLNKALKIAQYFDSNPKAGDINGLIPILFGFFAQIMRIHFAKNKSTASIAAEMKIPPFILTNLMKEKNNYNPKKIAENIEVLYQYDLKAKGVGSNSENRVFLMREMLLQIIL
jgi:DNA polymerase-3 subunit delta